MLCRTLFNSRLTHKIYTMQKVADTSILANEASKPHRQTNYDKILQAMNRLPNKEGIADTIAVYCSLDKIEISRRLGEMSKGESPTVKDTGRKGMTVKGCLATVWRVIDKKEPKVQLPLFS